MPAQAPTMSRQRLLVLVLEDNPDDAELEIRQLRRAGFELEWERVETERDFAARLRPELDVILSDHSLPGMDSDRALHLLRESGLDVPLIIVSGTIGEDQAVQAIKHGAADYLLKDRLSRLGEAVRTAIADRRLRDEKRQALEKLHDLQQKTAESLALLDTLQTHAPVGIALVDREFRHLKINEVLAAINGRPVAENIGRTIEELVPSLWPQLEPHYRSVLRTGEEVRDVEITGEAPARPGEVRHWLMNLYPVRRDDLFEGIGIIVVDITDRNRGEQELRRARDEAQTANKIKDEFIAALSHELRTPLNPVLMLTSELARSPELTEKLREDFEFIRRNVELEARLIDDLLDISRISSGSLQLNLGRVDVHEVIRDAADVLLAQFQEKQITLVVDLAAGEYRVEGDHVRLQQVFWNTLKNALRFTPEGGTITVRTSNPANEGTLRVEIADTGIGMTPAELSQVFQPFARGERAIALARQHRFGGLGIGMSITRALIDLHHGRISAWSEGRGRGSVIRADLPLAAPASTAARGPQEPSRNQKPLHILVVEDHEPTRSTLVRLLRRRGYKVAEAEDVAGARACIRVSSFDLILSDIGLPDGSGHELLAEFRANGNKTPAIALSGFGMDHDIQRSSDTGFAQHLTKPIDIGTLERAIRCVLGGS